MRIQQSNSVDWAHLRKGIKRFSVHEAAKVIIGFDPMDSGYLPDDAYPNLQAISVALKQAVDDGDLLPVGIKEQYGEPAPTFNVQDLKQWADSHGYEWPIPLRPAPAPTVAITTTEAPSPAPAVAPPPAAAPEEGALSTTVRNTLLKLVIGMAVAGYKYDPAAKKNQATTDIASDLAGLGMHVTDETILKYLRQAAQTVLPTKPPQP